ncbi:ABC transporter ATP-binding protein [Sediminibacterium sp.]|uniref:ABC transporter ATP-binding protein n=1 Tax=Sediminibacterium sp. TaxID=1917865 RepID=UPI003F6E461E
MHEFSFIKNYKRAALLITDASPIYAAKLLSIQVVLAIIPSALIFVVKKLVDIITQPSLFKITELTNLIIVYIGIQLISALLTQWSSQLLQIYQEKLTNTVSSTVLLKATQVDYMYYEQSKYHDTLHIAQQQALHKSGALLTNLTTFIQQFLTLLAISIFLFTIHWGYALFFISIPIPLSIVKAYFTRESFIKEKDLAEKDRQSIYFQHLATSPLYAKEIRIFSLGDFLINKYNKLRTYIFAEKRKLLTIRSKYIVMIEFIEIITIGFLLFNLAKNAWEQTITAGLFILYLQTFQRIQVSAKSWMQALIGLYQQRLFLNHLFQFLDLAPISKKEQQSMPSELEKLVINNLFFSYPESDKEILHGISLEARKGELIAIVGENGSGKSTLIKILADLYPIYTGNILLNQTRLSEIDPISFRTKAAILFQDFEKYYFSVADNITMGQSNADKEKIETAARKAGADFIHSLPQGFSTQLGRSFGAGTQLSGGQWQKLGLSRIFYKDAPLIILDEPGSTLDAAAEMRLFEELHEQAKDKIIVVVTHRLYSLVNANRIYVLQNGSIVEQGNFKDLMTTNGVFKAMFELQSITQI